MDKLLLLQYALSIGALLLVLMGLSRLKSFLLRLSRRL